MAERPLATPLAGIRVLEFSHTVMGPTAGLIFAELGAVRILDDPGLVGVVPTDDRDDVVDVLAVAGVVDAAFVVAITLTCVRRRLRKRNGRFGGRDRKSGEML